MKNLRSILAALVVLLTATAAHAQQPALKGTIPFNFVVGDRAYPAGDYVFRHSDNLIKITNAEQSKTVIAVSNACGGSTPSKDSKLVFERMGGYYFLRQIWVVGYSQGRELPRSRTQVHLAQNHENRESVIVAANISR